MLKCLFGFHDWGSPTNVRDKDIGLMALFVPFFLLSIYCGLPKCCDKTCKRCGKTKVFDYP